MGRNEVAVVVVVKVVVVDVAVVVVQTCDGVYFMETAAAHSPLAK